jgi:hypothetical protein
VGHAATTGDPALPAGELPPSPMHDTANVEDWDPAKNKAYSHPAGHSERVNYATIQNNAARRALSAPPRICAGSRFASQCNPFRRAVPQTTTSRSSCITVMLFRRQYAVISTPLTWIAWFGGSMRSREGDPRACAPAANRIGNTRSECGWRRQVHKPVLDPHHRLRNSSGPSVVVS